MSGLDDIFAAKKAPTVLENSVRRANGYGIITDPELGVTNVETIQCCHCGGHWIFQKGSGIRRGFCLKCAAITCGQKECDPCVPTEKRLDLREAKARRDANISQLR